jgi:hypothetical protein
MGWKASICGQKDEKDGKVPTMEERRNRVWRAAATAAPRSRKIENQKILPSAFELGSVVTI